MSADLARGLYNAEDYSRAADTIRRIGNCHEYRLASELAARPGRAVAAARLAIDLVETATIAELRAMVVQLTTPELRPAVPVVLGPTSAPAGSDTQPSKEGVGGLAAPTPPALVQRVLDLVRVYGDARADYARRAVDENTVERAFGAVETAVEPLAVGALIGELDRGYRGDAL